MTTPRSRPKRAVQAPAEPRLDGELDELALDRDRLVAGVERARVVGAPLAETEARGASVVGSRLLDVDLSGARLRGLRLVDVDVDRGNLANLIAPELSLQRVAISGARLTGVQWTRGRITDVRFHDCRIDLATFAGTTFERVVFDGCLLGQAEFRETLLRSVRFDHCDLTEADLTGARIDRCELRACTLDGLAGAERLRGAAMPWADVVGNAALLATALGIRVLGDDER
jgi:uncharacterized protein YjbI with pentapeptide repeats